MINKMYTDTAELLINKQNLQDASHMLDYYVSR